MSRPNSAARTAWDRAHAARDAGDLAAARRWLQRAYRLVPGDALVRLTLGALLLETGEPGEAAPLLLGVAQAHDAPTAWTALASCYLATGAETACLDALAAALRSGVLTPDLEALAGRIVARWPRPGWCGVAGDGNGPVRTRRCRGHRRDGTIGGRRVRRQPVAG